MTLARHGFVAAVVGTAVTLLLMVLLGGARVVEFQVDAAATRAELVLLDLEQRLGRRATSGRGLALAAPAAFAELPPDTLAALLDPSGTIMVTSASASTTGPTPADWASSASSGDARWTAPGLRSVTTGARLHDDRGGFIAVLVVHEKHSVLPQLARLFGPPLQWGGVLLLALAPAAWFGTALVVAPLARQAAAATAMVSSVATLRDGRAAGPECALQVGPDLATFGCSAAAALQGYENAVEAVSLTGDGAPEGAARQADTGA